MNVGVTGHQDLGGAQTTAWVESKMEEFVAKGPISRGYTCLAIGADQLYANTLLRHGIPYTAVIPAVGYSSTFVRPQDLAQYQRLLSGAETVHQLTFSHPCSEAYMAAGEFIVEECDLMLAVWNGKPAQGRGGTADVVRYALTLRKQVIQINPLTRVVLELC